MISRLLEGLGARVRDIRYFLGDLAYLLSRPFRGVGQRLSSWLRSIPPAWRMRGGVALGAVVLAAIVVLAVVPNLPCSFPGGDECAPDDQAIELVPADALAYVHLNIEGETDEAEAAAALGARTPLLTEQVIGQIAPMIIGGAGSAPDFEKDIQPWFGGEIALAVVPGSTGTQSVQLLEVDDEEAAREYEEAIAAGSPEPEDYKGVELREDERGLASAIAGDFLVTGSADGVRSLIDVSTGAEGAESLAADDVASEARDALPPEHFAQAYLSAEGIDGFLGQTDGALASLEPLVDSGDSQGAAFALGADDSGYRLYSRSVLDPDRSEDAGGFFSAFEPFEPALPAEIAPDALVYAGFGDADETVESLLGQATVRAPGIASGFTDLVERLRRDAGVDIADELVPALGGEGAIVIAPRPSPSDVGTDGISEDDVPDELQSPDAPETIQGGRAEVPYLAFTAASVDEEATADALAGLQEELAKSVDRTVADPVFRERAIGDVTAQVLQRSPTDVLAYAIADEMLVVADDTAPIERLSGDPDSGLAGSEAYDAAIQGLADEPGLIAYLDLGGLVTVAERLGAGAEGPFTTFAEDLRKLQTLALTVGAEDDVLAGDALLRVAAP